MNNKVKTGLWLVALIVLVGGATVAYNELRERVEPQSDVSIKKDGEDNATVEKIIAPDFTAIGADGTEVKFSELMGKPIVLNFWASWCPPCKEEMPYFNTVYEEMKEDITFVMVDMVDGARETEEKGRKHVESEGYTFPVYYDTEQSAASTYGVSALPTTVFIDKDGYIVTGLEGAMDEKTLRRGIELIK